MPKPIEKKSEPVGWRDDQDRRGLQKSAWQVAADAVAAVKERAMGQNNKAVAQLIVGATKAAAESERAAVFCQMDALSALYEGISKAGRIIKEGEAVQTAQKVSTGTVEMEDLIARVVTDMCGEGLDADIKADEFFEKVRKKIRDDRRCRGQQ
jgi:hypothetical protein